MSDRRPEDHPARRGWAGAVFRVPPAGLGGHYPKWRAFVAYGLGLAALIALALLAGLAFA